MLVVSVVTKHHVLCIDLKCFLPFFFFIVSPGYVEKKTGALETEAEFLQEIVTLSTSARAYNDIVCGQ